MATLTTPFDRAFFDPQQRFKSIGGGASGGKASGLALAQNVLSSHFDGSAFKRVEVSIPSLTVVRTEVFDEFIRRNDLAAYASGEHDDESIARAFQRAELPVPILGDLRAIVDEVHIPLAIRSSSMLEDDLSRPFAGVYATKMIPNNQPSADERFRRLTEAIKFVYASTFFAEARAYLLATGRPGIHDRMAVIIQEVVGTRFRDRFYPHVSGVARSYNYYPSGHAAPADGVITLALGLGKSIVDGGVCWTYSPAWPTAPAPFASADEIATGTQRSFWSVNMGKAPRYDPIAEAEYLEQCSLADAEQDGTLARTASTLDPQSGTLKMGIGTAGLRVLDFAALLAIREPPLNDVVRSLLRLFEDELKMPVEIEFAMTFDPHRFGFLQVRPMMVTSDVIDVTDADLASPDALIRSRRVLGNGASAEIRDVVYVVPGHERLDTRAIAAEIETLNAELQRTGTPYVLIGFGRWGSSDPSLGIPVVWSQISGARAIVEAMRPELNVEPSQGSHFFHNLSAFHVPYFTVAIGDRDAIRWEWLERQQVIHESALLRQVRADEPLSVKVDGRSGRGVILVS